MATKVLILGGGATGSILAEELAREDSFDVTVVDHNKACLDELKDRLDIQTVHGHASHPNILRQAGIKDTDVLIAVTESDEINMVACQVSHSLYRTRTKIARIRATEYTEDLGDVKPNGDQSEDDDPNDDEKDNDKKDEQFFSNTHMPIDETIHPERLVTTQIKQLLEHPGALQIVDVAGGKLQIVAFRAFRNGLLAGRAVHLLYENISGVRTKVVAILRGTEPIVPTPDTVVEENDEVFFLVATEDIDALMATLRESEKPVRNVIIAGGGYIGFELALAIQDKFDVKVIEMDAERAGWIAERLNNCLVVSGNATERRLLEAEDIETADMFCAVTGDDEDNIMAALLAKRLGVQRVMSLIAKPEYVDLVLGSDINIAISPKLSTVNSILSHVRHNLGFKNDYRLRRGAAELLDVEIRGGERRFSKVIGRRVSELNMPNGTTVGAIVRGDEVIINGNDTVIQDGDSVIVFVADQRLIKPVRKLFQVGLGFF